MPVRDVHHALDDVFAVFRELVLAGDGARASDALQIYRVLTAEHAAAEEVLLLPVTPQARRWADDLYTGQHAKLLAAIDRIPPLLRGVDAASTGWRGRALAALDTAGPLHHLAEHHHLAEEQDLFPVVATTDPGRLTEVAARFWAHHATLRTRIDGLRLP